MNPSGELLSDRLLHISRFGVPRGGLADQETGFQALYARLATVKGGDVYPP